MMLIKYIFGYIIILFVVYYCNDIIVDILGENQALIRFIELTLPLSIPSLVYFFQVNKDRRERLAKEREKVDNIQNDEKDKFEKSLPFFYVKDKVIYTKNPQKSPILNVKIKIINIQRDLPAWGGLYYSYDDIHTVNNICIGGLADGDEIFIEKELEKRNVSNDIRWFVLSAITATNDIIYFIYLPFMKTGWHFYRKKESQESMLVKYIGENDYCGLARSLVNYVLEYEDQFYYKESILNDAIASLNQDDLQEAFAQLIVLVGQVEELPVYEIIYVLHKSCLMLNYLESSKRIEPNYFLGKLSSNCDFTEKYKNLLGKVEPGLMLREYMQDIIKLINEDEKVSLKFWLRNIEVYIRDGSRISNERALRRELKETIPPLVGGIDYR